MTRPNTTTTGALMALLAFALFAVHDVIVKHLGASYSTFQIVFFTALLSFPALTIVLISDEKPGTLRPRHPWWIALRSLAGAVSGLCAFYAFATLPLSEVYAYIFAAPLLITVLAIPVLGETVRLRRGLAVLVGLVGVIIVLQPGATALSPGHIAALTAAVASALASVIVRKVGAEERKVLMILYPMLTNLAVTAVVLPFVYIPVPLAHLALLAADSLLVLVAMWLLVLAYSRTAAAVVAPMQYSQIIWATVFGILLFAEYPEWHIYLGTGVIMASGLYILWRESTDSVSENTPVLRNRTRPGHVVSLRVSQLLKRPKGKG